MSMSASLRRSYLEKGPTGPSVSFLPGAWLPVSRGVWTGHCCDTCTHPELNTSRSDLSITVLAWSSLPPVPEMGEVHVDPTYHIPAPDTDHGWFTSAPHCDTGGCEGVLWFWPSFNTWHDICSFKYLLSFNHCSGSLDQSIDK